ncbi:MAG: hypothetical protein ACOZAR_03195 [Patescibacteria group bacterium]
MSIEELNIDWLPRNPDECSIKDARMIFENRFFGPDSIRLNLGIDTNKIKIPKLSISRKDLVEFKRQDYLLFLMIDQDEDGNRLEVYEILRRFKNSQKNDLIKESNCFWQSCNKSNIRQEKINAGWILVKNAIFRSEMDNNYLDQIRLKLIEFRKLKNLQKNFFAKEEILGFLEKYREIVKNQDLEKMTADIEVIDLKIKTNANLSEILFLKSLSIGSGLKNCVLNDENNSFWTSSKNAEGDEFLVVENRSLDYGAKVSINECHPWFGVEEGNEKFGSLLILRV